DVDGVGVTRFGDAHRQRQEDEVTGGHVGDGDARRVNRGRVGHVDGRIGQRRATPAGEVDGYGEVLRVVVGGDGGGPFQFHAMALAVVERHRQRRLTCVITG